MCVSLIVICSIIQIVSAARESLSVTCIYLLYFISKFRCAYPDNRPASLLHSGVVLIYFTPKERHKRMTPKLTFKPLN